MGTGRFEWAGTQYSYTLARGTQFSQVKKRAAILQDGTLDSRFGWAGIMGHSFRKEKIWDTGF